jgi:hypothetical protein
MTARDLQKMPAAFAAAHARYKREAAANRVRFAVLRRDASELFGITAADFNARCRAAIDEDVAGDDSGEWIRVALDIVRRAGAKKLGIPVECYDFTGSGVDLQEYEQAAARARDCAEKRAASKTRRSLSRAMERSLVEREWERDTNGGAWRY